MESTNVRPRRRRYLIDRKFQLPVALALAGTGLVMLAYHLVVVHFIVAGAREGLILETRPLVTMLPLVAILMVAFAWLGIHVTHRIVGPAYRLTQTMRAMSGGELATRAHLRKGDALKEVAAALNALGDALEARRASETELRADLRRAIDSGAAPEALLAILEAADQEAALFEPSAPSDSSEDDPDDGD